VGACDPALEWLAEQAAAGVTDPQILWESASGEWLLWAARRVGVRPPPEWATRQILPLALRAAARTLAGVGLEAHALALSEAADRCEVASGASGASYATATARATAYAAYDAADAAYDAARATAFAAAYAAYVAAYAADVAADADADEIARRAADPSAAAEITAEIAAEIARRVRVLWPEPPPELLAALRGGP
jgi:hypothetical protein